MKLAITLTASVLSLGALDARAAVPADDPYSVTVRYGDLDLDRQAGVRALYLRIRAAAKTVCDQQANERLAPRMAYAACVDRAVTTAVARIDRPMLSEYVARLGGKTPERVAAR